MSPQSTVWRNLLLQILGFPRCALALLSLVKKSSGSIAVCLSNTPVGKVCLSQRPWTLNFENPHPSPNNTDVPNRNRNCYVVPNLGGKARESIQLLLKNLLITIGRTTVFETNMRLPWEWEKGQKSQKDRRIWTRKPIVVWLCRD